METPFDPKVHLSHLADEARDRRAVFVDSVRSYVLGGTPLDSDALGHMVDEPELTDYVLAEVGPDLPEPADRSADVQKRAVRINGLMNKLWELTDRRGREELAARKLDVEEDKYLIQPLDAEDRYGIPGISASVWGRLGSKGRL